MFNIGPAEMIVILIIALIVFGPKRLPEIGRTVGKSLREFRRASQDLRDEFESHLQADEDQAPRDPAKSSTDIELPETDTAPSPDGASSTSSEGSATTS